MFDPDADVLDADRFDAATDGDSSATVLLQRGQHWSVIFNGIGDTLRADDLDAAIDADGRDAERLGDGPNAAGGVQREARTSSRVDEESLRTARKGEKMEERKIVLYRRRHV